MVVLGLIVSTAFYSGLCFYTDLKSREIYVFFARVLSVLWGIYLIHHINRMELVVFILIHLVVLLGMDFLKIWGGGDSEFLFLFSLIYLASLNGAFSVTNLIFELLSIVLGVSISLVLGVAQKLIQRESITKHSEFAVVPGLALISVFYLVRVLYG